MSAEHMTAASEVITKVSHFGTTLTGRTSAGVDCVSPQKKAGAEGGYTEYRRWLPFTQLR